MNKFVAHASVRIKGTEHIYEPVFCSDTECDKRYVIHMHCPFCVRTESFIDPVILKAHYRVKHVDKGIEYGGLKIVRCCDHCDIVGSIKGSKEIKGAHWHCYRCRNGFNRRDEAQKHYRTHFRTPETTFQIHIPQDVNQVFVASTPSSDLATQSGQEPPMSSVNMDRVDGVVVANDDRCLQVSVAANETVGTTATADLPVVMVLPPSSNSVASVVRLNSGQEVSAAIFTLKNEIAAGSLSETWSPQESNLSLEIGDKQQLVQNNKLSGAQLQIRQLQLQVQKQAEEIETLKKREEELLNQLEVDLDDRLAELLERTKSDHEALLRQQLLNVRAEYLRHLAPSPNTTPSRNHHAVAQPMFILNGSTGQPFQIIQAAKLHPSSLSRRFTPFTSGTELLSGILPCHNGDVAEHNDDGDDDEEEKADQHLEENSGQDEIESETVQNYIVDAGGISEYVNTEDGVRDNSDIQSEDVVCSLVAESVISVSRKRSTDLSESGILLKRERV